MNQKIKIIVAEDLPIIRNLLIDYIDGIDGFEVIANASNGKNLIGILKDHTPDVIIMDLNMPVLNGWEVLDIIKMRFSQSKVIVLSANDDLETVAKLIIKGASGFLSKRDEMESIVSAIKDVYYTGKYVNKIVIDAMLNNSLKQDPESNIPALSERETQIVREVCNGLSNKLISEKLFVSSSTVDFHKQSIYKKTNSKNAIELFIYALKNKIIYIE